jgi:hypothetical protein
METETNTILSWTAPEYRHYPKNVAWYVTFAAVIALLIIFQLLEKDWFGALSVAIIAGFAWFFARQTPEHVEVAITENGIAIGQQYIPHHQIKHFWMVDSRHHNTVNFETVAVVDNVIVVELHEQDPEEVRAVLAELLPEHPQKEPTWAQIIAHRLHF